MPTPDASGALAAFVLDDQHAWSITRGPGSTDFSGASTDVLKLVVNRTSNGGASWQQVILPASYPGTTQSLVFVDQLRGYLMVSAMRHSAGSSTILTTKDGGATWTVAGTGPWLGSLFSANDASTLWAGAPQEAGPVEHPLLDVSRDGGRTWIDAQLPGFGGALGGGDRWLVGPPRFSDPLTGLVTIAWIDSEGKPHTRIELTTDGGRSWATVTDWLGQAAADPAMLDAKHWVLPVENPLGLIATENGGSSWQALQTTGLASGWVVWIEVVDAGQLAALTPTGNSDQGPEALFLSIDGGHTWRPVDLGPAS